MPTLILTPRFTEDSQALWRAAGLRGWRVERLTSWRVPNELLSVQEPVFYLESLFGPSFAEQFGYRMIEPPDDWLPRLPIDYRKRTISLMTLDEARRIEGKAFIKPANDKSFPARVYGGHELPEGYEGDSPVLVSEIVEWKKEFRCFIPDRRLMTSSIYLRDGVLQRENGFATQVDEVREMTEFVEAILSDDRVEFPRTAVMDVGVIKGAGWAVVEQNSAWGAGIYGCDPHAVLDVLRYAALPLNRSSDS